MPREFAITTPSPTVSLEPNGKGEVVFTVSNATDAPMRAKATLLLPPELKQTWVKIRGERSREMPPGSTEAFAVDFTVPPEAPPGTYSFRLVVADVALPDERYAEGPVVAVTVVPPAAPSPRTFPWWVVVLGALIIMGGAVAAFFLLRDGEEEPAPTCSPGQQRCEGQCVDTRNSRLHCGTCGNACEANFECQEGQCVRTSCPAGQELCNGACVDTRTDSRHCGACGTACDPHLTCRGGRCLCPEATQSHCADRCVDTRTDEQNCGQCGRRCGANQTCENGSCRCDSGLTLCGGTCVNLQTHDSNCGRCGNRCGTNTDCRNGRCIPRSDCPVAGQILCPCTGTCLPRALCAKRCQQDVQPF